MNIFIIINSFIKKNISKSWILFFAFVIFSIFYFLNLNNYNFFATDFRARYKPNGVYLINQIINFNFYQIDLFNFYFIPELITGLLLKIFPDDKFFSITSNLLNIFLLFLSFNFFFKSINQKNINLSIFIFLIFFFLYIGNWIWCFWKLADIYFLFIFSIIFHLLCQGVKHKKIDYIIYSLILTFVSLLTKPQGIIIFPFFIISVFLLYYKKKVNFFKFLGILFLIYLFCFPLLIFFLKKLDYINVFVTFMSQGNISGTIHYKFDQFLDNFYLQENNISEILYFYFLFIKKIVYQLTFIRDTYSFNHNLFLIIYALIFYFFLIINMDYISKKENIFTKLTFLITFLSILFHSSLGTADEPNRYQLFNLVPQYILVSISIEKFLKCTTKTLKK